LWLVDEAGGRVDGDLEDYAKRLRAKEQGQVVGANRRSAARSKSAWKPRAQPPLSPSATAGGTHQVREKEIETLGAERLRLKS